MKLSGHNPTYVPKWGTASPSRIYGVNEGESIGHFMEMWGLNAHYV